MMKKFNETRLTLIGIFIGLFIFQISFSQENYIPGLIIRSNNDTLFGYVDYRNWGRNPDKINFKLSLETDLYSFGPANINEFRVKDEIYVSGIVILEDGHHINKIVDTVFLQTLIKGEKSLYYYKSGYGIVYFFIKTDENYELLIYQRKQQNINGRKVITEDKRYLGQLSFYLNECPSIHLKISNVRYNQKSLLNFFEHFIECSMSETYYYIKEREKIITEGGIISGVSITSLKFNTSIFLSEEETYFNSSTNFSTGLFLNFVLPREQRKWSSYNELMYSTYKVYSDNWFAHIPNSQKNVKFELGYTYLKINNMFRYKHPIGQIHLFFNGGISNGLVINETNIRTEASINGPILDYTILARPAMYHTRKYEQGYILGTGGSFDRYSLEFRFENGNGMSAYKELNSLTKRYFILFGYKL
jgi:hypothetical protein